MNVILAAGGTGGHLFPAVAIGQALTVEHRILFIGSGRPLDRQVEKESGMRWKHMKMMRIKGMSFLGKTLSLLAIPWAMLQALIIIIAEKPDLVVGLGGYSTGPLVLMARFLGIKAAVLEQNAIPGLTNRILSYFVNRIFVAFPEVRFGQWVRRKIRFTGNPTRREIIEQFNCNERDEQIFTLLVFGGSQGTHFLNQLIIDCTEQLKSIDDLRIIHLTGRDDYDLVCEHYQKHPGLKVHVAPFSNNMGTYYKKANLVVSRAGASTIADLIYFGRASVLVPYPFAADHHQDANALYLEKVGACRVFKQDVLSNTIFYRLLKDWLEDRQALERMESQALSLKQEDATQRIIEECKELVTGHV
jgi:UDP-N-acetylglucosamine--N-acetylmuramyl-(pentapeptide) pyrophosphoryl-undecaprenol N-acetylglucosamine transferase